MHSHAERGNDQIKGFPAKAGPTKRKRAFDLRTEEDQSPPIATLVQAERRFRGVGRAAWMRRERRQDMDVRSARAHGASPE